jgi:hypothetical protein
MTAVLKHFKPHQAPATANAPIRLPIAPAVQAIVVDRIPIVEPQLAAIVRNDAVSIGACPEDSHTTCPTKCKVIMSGKTMPPATSVPVVHSMTPASHVWPAAIQVLASATLTEIESILHEQCMAVNRVIRSAAL